jgi:hypothetical protein
VLFRISSFSRPAPHGNILIRLGFRAFGRREQLRFLKLTAERMARLTAEQERYRSAGAGRSAVRTADS